MKANFEIRYVKNGKSRILYWVAEIYEGIVADLYEKYERAGCKDISIRMI